MKYLTPLIVLILALLTACAPAATPTAVSIPPTAPPAPLEPTPATNAEPVTTTAEPIRKADLPMGRTEEGAFYLGDPNAPVQMLDYSNFL